MKRVAGAFVASALVVGAIVGVHARTQPYPPPVVLVHSITPGAVLTSDANEVCQPGYSKRVRDVSDELKTEVFREYGISRPAHYLGMYEVDHLISLELGGSNSISNLWPESATPPYGFPQKDIVENAAHEAVCSGKMKLIDAQFKIANDWVQLGRELGVLR